MKPTKLRPLTGGAFSALLLLALAATPQAQAEIEPAAMALAQAVGQKIGNAQTIRVTAKHHLDPRLGVGARIERGPITITVQRPNRFHAIQPGGEQTREIVFDGKTLLVMHPRLGHHGMAPLAASSIEQFADRVDERFGFRPPVAELLSEDVASQLFLHVTAAKVAGIESVGWTRCERLHFEQPGLTGDLWVGVKDKLPRRYRLTFTGIQGHPAWDIRLTKWEMNPTVDAGLFTKKPAADSHAIPMLKSR